MNSFIETGSDRVQEKATEVQPETSGVSILHLTQESWGSWGRGEMASPTVGLKPMDSSIGFSPQLLLFPSHLIYLP